MHHDAPEELAKVRPLLAGRLHRMSRDGPERRFVGSKTEELTLDRLATVILTNKSKFAIVGDKYKPIEIEVFCRLLALCCLPVLVGKGLHLDNATFWDLSLPWLRRSFAALIFAVEPKIGMTGALVPQLPVANDTRFNEPAQFVQQVLQRGIVGSFAGSASEAADLHHSQEIDLNSTFDRCHGLNFALAEDADSALLRIIGGNKVGRIGSSHDVCHDFGIEIVNPKPR